LKRQEQKSHEGFGKNIQADEDYFFFFIISNKKTAGISVRML
jgi:hypothetical protein